MTLILSIVVPLYNEEESVEILAKKLNEVISSFDFESEILLIDDGSTDGTWQKVESLKNKIPQIKGIRFRRNYGQTCAMVAGFDKAEGDIIVTLDGDLQNDPADITRLLAKLDEGYDIVSGWRANRKDNFTRVLPSKIANMIISATTGVKLHDYGCSLKAYRAECIKPVKWYGEMHRFFPALASMTGARIGEITVKHYSRKYGESKYGFNRIYKVISDIFSINLIIRFSSMPLKGFTICALPFGILFLLFSFLAILAIVLDWTQGKAIFFAIAGLLNLSAVINLTFMGIVGEMILATSSLEHTNLQEITTKKYAIENKIRNN